MHARTYDNLDPLLAMASMDIARELCPLGWDEVPGHEEPSTWEAVVDYFNRTGKIATTRLSEFKSGQKRMWGDAEPWQAFFVWHDRAHVEVPHSFNPEGEAAVHALQVSQLRDWASRQIIKPTPDALRRAEAVMAAHNLGRLERWEYYGADTPNLREFTLGYLAALNLTKPVPAPLIREA